MDATPADHHRERAVPPAFSLSNRSPMQYSLRCRGARVHTVILHHSMSCLIQILVATSPAAVMEARETVRAVPGKGLEGDRYFLGIGTFSPHPPKPDYEVTLIEKEHLEAFAAESGLLFEARSARRNLVTQGVNLNGLVGRQFRIGEVLFQGIRLCEPCNYLAKATSPEILRGLLHKAGLRAQILSEGILRVGDELTEDVRG